MFDLFQQLVARQPSNLDVTHAFYLGYEMAKATTALTLGKQYVQAHTEGFEALREHVKDYPPEAMAWKTWRLSASL